MASTLDLLKRLADRGTHFVVIGGMAGTLHGCSMVTEDLDVCAPLDSENLPRILAALGDLHPAFRMRPDRPPLPADPARLAGFKNLYLATDLGQLDILDEVSGIGGFEEVAKHAVEIRIDNVTCKVLDLETVIRSKRALGRPRDLQAALELEAIRQRLGD